MHRCPCLSGLSYNQCCEPFHLGTSLAPTAERLMRSRFTAYSMSLNHYVRETWHVSTRPAVLELDDEVRWIGLEIVGRTRGGLLDKIGSVEFRATYTLNGHSGVQHENSKFFREGRTWLYVDAIK